MSLFENKIKSKMIIANAGSGKTYNIIQHIKEIINTGYSPSSILCITFTNAGRNEMAQRLQKEIPNLTSLPKIVTFHSLCKEIINTFTYELEMPLEYETVENEDFELQQTIESTLLFNKKVQNFINKCKISTKEFSKITSDFFKNYHKLNYNTQERLEQICQIFELQPEDLSQKIKIMQEILCNIPLQMLQNVGGKTLNNSMPNILEIQAKYQNQAVSENSINDFTKLCQLAGRSTKKNSDYLIYKQTLNQAQEEINDILSFEKCYYINEIAQDIINEIEKIKKNYRKYTFDDLIYKAKSILENEELRDFALFKFGSSFLHILVDEAQDTNPDQWNILSYFISEQIANGMENSSLLIVGDTKQTIYSFQGAKANIMEEIYTKYSTFLEKQYLTKSFRTTQPILDTINNLQNLTQEHPHISNFEKSGGLVEIFNINNKIEDEEAIIAKKTLEIIQSMLGKTITHEKYPNKILEPKDFAILLKQRTPKVINALKQTFSEANIPISFNEKLKFQECHCVLDLIATLKLCIIEQDQLSLYGILKSPIFAIPEHEFEHHFNHSNQNSLTHFPIVQEFIQKYRTILNEKGIFLFFKEIFHNFHQNYSIPEQQILENFINQSLSFDQYNPIKFIQHFEESNNEVIIKTQSQNAITCTTIHASKGLEYPVVFYIEAHNNKTNKNAIIFHKGIALFSSSQNKRGTTIETILNEQKAIELEEETRLNYVAISRAAFAFFCIASHTHSTSDTSFINSLEQSLKLLPSISTNELNFSSTLYTLNPNIEIKPTTQTQTNEIQRIEITQNKFYTKNPSYAEQYGNFIHKLFEHSPNITSYLEFINEYHSLNENFEEFFQNEFNKVIKISKILEEKFKPIQIHKEKEYFYKGKIIRLDTVYFTENEIIIIDYKTQKPQLTHEISQQLTEYSHALFEIHKIPVKAFVMWFTDEHLEEVPQHHHQDYLA